MAGRFEQNAAGFGAAIVFGLHGPLRGFFGGLAIGVVETISAGYANGGLASLVPLLFIILYAFTTEERSFEFPPPGYTLKWFGVAWNRPDVWAALGLSVKVALVWFWAKLSVPVPLPVLA